MFDVILSVLATSLSTWLNILAFSLLLNPAEAAPEHILDDSFKYITVCPAVSTCFTHTANILYQRPDIEAPRWNVTIYDQDRVSPGYWFVEPYDYLDQSLINGGKWTAPMIFDGTGELIWSGAVRIKTDQ